MLVLGSQVLRIDSHSHGILLDQLLNLTVGHAWDLADPNAGVDSQSCMPNAAGSVDLNEQAKS